MWCLRFGSVWVWQQLNSSNIVELYSWIMHLSDPDTNETIIHVHDVHLLYSGLHLGLPFNKKTQNINLKKECQKYQCNICLIETFRRKLIHITPSFGEKSKMLKKSEHSLKEGPKKVKLKLVMFITSTYFVTFHEGTWWLGLKNITQPKVSWGLNYP